MKNEVIYFDKDAGMQLIEENYIVTCGLNKNKAALQKMRPHAMKCLREVMKTAEIKAVISEYGAECIGSGELIIENEHFVCPALHKEMIDEIIAVIPFAVTAGDIYSDDERVLNQAYFDIGGTAVTDAARDLLQNRISEKYGKGAFVSSSFGPGFYGMPALDVVKIFKFLDCDKIGISLLQSGFMFPAKSCVGFFIVSSREENLPVMDCEHCFGRGKMCNYCKAGRISR